MYCRPPAIAAPLWQKGFISSLGFYCIPQSEIIRQAHDGERSRTIRNPKLTHCLQFLVYDLFISAERPLPHDLSSIDENSGSVEQVHIDCQFFIPLDFKQYAFFRQSIH